MAIDRTKLEELIEKMKAEAKELGLDIEEKLDEAKAEWAETAVSERRQLRAFWGIVGTVAGALIGLGVGYLMWGF